MENNEFDIHTFPPAKFSLIKISEIDCINPNPLKRKTSEIIRNKIVLFINKFQGTLTIKS